MKYDRSSRSFYLTDPANTVPKKIASLSSDFNNQLTMYLPNGSTMDRDLNVAPAPSMVHYLNLAMKY